MAKGFYPEFTKEDIDKIVKNCPVYNEGGLAASRPPFYEGLVNGKLKLCYDKKESVEYEFTSLHDLTWQGEDKKVHKEYYDALQADENVILIVHTINGSSPQQARMIVLETDTRLVTTFFASIGNEVSAREVDRDIVFGYIDDGTKPPTARHSLTDDLIGRSIIWTYSPQFSIQHIYASRWYSAFVDFNTFYGGTLLSSPCNYVKINDHVYIYSWVETEGAGIQGFALMNLFDMHDVGCFFGINGDSKFECYTFGAVGKYVGQLTNIGIPNDQNKTFEWPPVIPNTKEVL